MHERTVDAARSQDETFRKYVRGAASSPANLATLADLRDRDLITEEESQRAKAKALSSTYPTPAPRTPPRARDGLPRSRCTACRMREQQASYCSKVSDLKKSVQDLGNVKIIQNGPSAVTSAVQSLKSNADAAVSAAKSDFPSETSALTSAIDALEQSAKSLTSSPAATSAALPGQITAAKTAVQNFANATSSKCG